MRDGSEVLVQATLEEWLESLRFAMAKQEQILIEQPDGSSLAVNPQEVQLSREAD
jgi:hypothetical protein